MLVFVTGMQIPTDNCNINMCMGPNRSTMNEELK